MKTEKIELVPVGQSPTKPLKWEMSLNGGVQQGPPNKYPDLTVAKGDTADFSFTIRHPGGIAFAKDNPFCAQAGAAKPTACDTQAFTWEMDAKTGALVVHDHNPKEAMYTYVVNFDRAPQLDPVIRNGGCCTGTNQTTYSLMTIVEYGALFLLLVAAVIAARQIFLRRNNDTIKPS